MYAKIIGGFKNIIESVSDKVSYWSVDDSSNELEKDFTILLNQYVGLLCIIFFIHGLSVYYFIGFTKNSFYLILISVVFFISYFLKEHRKNSYLLGFIFLFLSCIITYYSSYCGFESGVFLFYFPLLLALPFFFNMKKSKWKIILIMLVIIVSLYSSVIEDFNLVSKSTFLTAENGYLKKLLLLNITFSLLTFGITYYFVGEKKGEYYNTILINKTKSQQIDELQTKVYQLKSHLVNNSLSDDNINEIISLAQTNDALFIEKFDLYFPYFFDNIRKSSQAPLSFSDLYFCAMIKLNFSNKQIALYSNSTIKSVESKKYRLRKKLNIPAHEELNLWILSI